MVVGMSILNKISYRTIGAVVNEQKIGFFMQLWRAEDSEVYRLLRLAETISEMAAL